MRNKTTNVYTEWLPLIDSLNNEEAGIIFKTILQYQNGEEINYNNPIWFFIKSKIDEYNNKYEDVRKKCKKAGTLGGLKKASNKQMLANASECYQTIANSSESSNKTKQNKTKQNKTKENKNISLEKKTDPFFNPLVEAFKKEYRNVFKKTVYLNKIEINNLISLQEDIPDIECTFSEVLTKLKYIEFKDINFKPNASWLLKENHYTSILNGEYDTKAKANPKSNKLTDIVKSVMEDENE